MFFASGLNIIILKKGWYNMYILRMITYILVIIGAINWGLIGFFNFDLVASIFGEMTFLTRLVYDLVGISAIILLLTHRDIFIRI